MLQTRIDKRNTFLATATAKSFVSKTVLTFINIIHLVKSKQCIVSLQPSVPHGPMATSRTTSTVLATSCVTGERCMSAGVHNLPCSIPNSGSVTG